LIFNIKTYKYGGHPAPDGASPTQPYKCGQNVKNLNRVGVDGDGDVVPKTLRTPLGCGKSIG